MTSAETRMVCFGSAADILEGSSKGLEIDNHYLFVVKKDGQLYLYRNRCPHLGTPLEWQEDRFLDADGSLIQCSTHGALFQISSGECLAGPCKGKYLHAIPFTLVEGLIMVSEITLRHTSP
jgi:nitrite reductase/ring-hydroxylating ferredoxin subunit